MAISGHKFLGVPFPCGIFMMEKRFLKYVTNNIEYIGSADCTISGSRNGHAPLFLKHAIDHVGFEGFQAHIERCIAYAEYLVEKIKGAWRNQNSITVVIPRPSDRIIQRWQLATEGAISHIVVMPHVTKATLDAFLEDLKTI
jgi:histidine decarboxylase